MSRGRDSAASTPAEGQARVAALVALAREQLRGQAPHRGERTFTCLRAQMTAPATTHRRRSLRMVALPAAGAFALAAAAILALNVDEATPALEYRVDAGVAARPDGLLGTAGGDVAFSDGSTIHLPRGAQARVASIDHRGARVEVVEGEAAVSITKLPKAAWSFDAGPYHVRVTGTAFDISWTAASQAFQLRMHEGEVWVTGPLIEQSLRLRAGQRVRASVERHRLAIDEPDLEELAQAGPTPDVPVAWATVEAHEPPVAPTTTVARISHAHGVRTQDVPASPRHTSRAADTGPWAKRLARGDFAGVVAEAEAMGTSRALRTSPVSELTALADAARFLKRNALARRALLSLRRRFPASASAEDAAFLLGRLGEAGAAHEARQWYARYLDESPEGPHAADALGRSMLVRYRQQGASAALDLARDYTRRYPRGSYGKAARLIEVEADPAR